MNLRKLLCGMLALCLMLTMAPVALMEEVAPEEVVIDLGEDAAEGGVEIEADALEAVDAYSETNPQKVTIHVGDITGSKITKKTLDLKYDEKAIEEGLELVAGASWKVNGKYIDPVVAENVVWTSSNSGVAAVDKETGEVTFGNKAGKATIKAIANNGKSASVAITITDKTAPKKVTISASKKKISNAADDYATLTARVSPVWQNTAEDVTWSSADTDIADVFPKKGSSVNVIGYKAGKVKITAKTPNGKKASVTITVTDMYDVTKISVVPEDAGDGEYELYADADRNKTVITLDATLFYGKDGDEEMAVEDFPKKYYGIEWTTSNKDKATFKKVQDDPSKIDVTLQGTGRVTLTAKSGKKSASVKIDIVNSHACLKLVKGDTTWNKDLLEKGFYTGETIDLHDYFDVISLDDCWDKVTYKAHHSAMVDIDSDGYATFNKKGTCKIDVKCGGKKITLSFKVKVDE